ncbi:MAG: LysM peptidoglycan-binding domain-containing protein [Bacteroidetes bacterium]|nr:LysM peptidoglycan-binding domain-containing protein [Bacteroidota bacterium]
MARVAESTKCPICGKKGIANFQVAPITCPQCNSDLKPYYLLNQLRSQRQRTLSPVATGIGGIILGALILAVALGTRFSQISSARFSPHQRITADSSEWYKKQLAILQAKQNTTSEHTNAGAWHYTVRAGDNLWTIAERFYGDGEQLQRIQADNGLSDIDKLIPGQTLTINPTP